LDFLQKATKRTKVFAAAEPHAKLSASPTVGV
jgi:hypothetical protein